ncbi:hypothetical protein [Xenorhabdus japonica]|uniref:Uncharacterized protein n=1 Tax=Xenorhabdus japonica TaxID=53341 RepID=A0A1I5CC12_9GAMM|nr:hypothetical protein [Xenorhabdus japonica]SFN84436.1 hypothetical protein SAMN05421579_12535 [Xenorhabdus japonica]
MTSDLRSKGIEIIPFIFQVASLLATLAHPSLNSIIYALNKINKKVRNLSGVVKNINIYVAEETERTEVRWLKIEDKKTYNELISKRVWVESPCLHINDKQITQVNKVKSLPHSFWGSSGLRNTSHSGQVGVNVSGVSDQLHQESISGKRKLLESNPECSTRVIASIVHEIGHILHAQRIESERKFWCARRTDEQGEYTIPAMIVEQVSDYAIQKNNSNEFVAEVFTGLPHNWSP